MATILKPSYGSTQTMTISLASLASDTTLLAGRESTAIDNTSELSIDALLGGLIKTAGSLTADRVIEIWVYASWDNATDYTGAATGSDANLTFASLGTKNMARLAEVISMTDTTARTYKFGPISVAQLFGGSMPDHWGIFVVHSTGAALSATAGDHVIKYRPLQLTNV